MVYRVASLPQLNSAGGGSSSGGSYKASSGSSGGGNSINRGRRPLAQKTNRSKARNSHGKTKQLSPGSAGSSGGLPRSKSLSNGIQHQRNTPVFVRSRENE